MKMKYRVKQVGNEFYPQYKKRFGWGYYKGEPYMTYDFMLEKYVAFENLYFDSLKNAEEFLTKQKESDTITYHDVK